MTEKLDGVPVCVKAHHFEIQLEAVFMVLQEKGDPRGAKAWLARLCEVNTSTVSRWVGSETPVPGPVKALLRELQTRADLVAVLRPTLARGAD